MEIASVVGANQRGFENLKREFCFFFNELGEVGKGLPEETSDLISEGQVDKQTREKYSKEGKEHVQRACGRKAWTIIQGGQSRVTNGRL